MVRPFGRPTRRIGAWSACVALGLALAKGAYADRLPVVALDLSGLSEVDYEEIEGVALENRMVLRLLQEGFTVVARRVRGVSDQTRPDVHIRVDVAGEKLRLSYADGARHDERMVKWIRGHPLPELHWLAAQKVVELARSWRGGAGGAVAPGPAPAPEAPGAAPGVVPPPAASRLGVALGARTRPAAADPVVAATWTREGAVLGLEGWVQGAWSRAHSLSVQDFELLLGVSHRWSFNDRWSLIAGALAGLGVHHYSSDLSGDPNASGSQAGFVISPALGIAFRASQRVELMLRASPGLAWPKITHTSAGETLWRREPLRLDAGVAVQRRFN